MTPFTVVSDDDAPGEPCDATLQAATKAAPTSWDSLPSGYTRADGHENDLPPTLLELPDLVAVSQWSDERWSTLGNRVFWVGIVLGSLAALYLIWQPARKVLPPQQDAPTWDGHAATDSNAAPASPPETSRATPAPAWPAESPPHEHAPTAAPETPDADSTPAWPAEPAEIDAQEPAPGHDAAPSFDEWSHQSATAAPVYTARTDPSRVDGGGEHAAPGEAMPTGKIKNVVTP